MCVRACACIFMRSTPSDVAARGLGTVIFVAINVAAQRLDSLMREKGRERERVCVCVRVYMCVLWPVICVAINIAAQRLDSLMRERARERVCVCVRVYMCVLWPVDL